MLHIGTVAKLKHNHRDWERQHEKDVNFYTLDLENHDIVRIESVIEDLKDIEDDLSLDFV